MGKNMENWAYTKIYGQIIYIVKPLENASDLAKYQKSIEDCLPRMEPTLQSCEKVELHMNLFRNNKY